MVSNNVLLKLLWIAGLLATVSSKLCDNSPDRIATVISVASGREMEINV